MREPWSLTTGSSEPRRLCVPDPARHLLLQCGSLVFPYTVTVMMYRNLSSCAKKTLDQTCVTKFPPEHLTRGRLWTGDRVKTTVQQHLSQSSISVATTTTSTRSRLCLLLWSTMRVRSMRPWPSRVRGRSGSCHQWLGAMLRRRHWP